MAVANPIAQNHGSLATHEGIIEGPMVNLSFFQIQEFHHVGFSSQIGSMMKHLEFNHAYAHARDVHPHLKVDWEPLSERVV